MQHRRPYVLCFDEFQVTDIADALILRRLFSSMLDAGTIVIVTSNRAPKVIKIDYGRQNRRARQKIFIYIYNL
jgi:predicted ATPase